MLNTNMVFAAEAQVVEELREEEIADSVERELTAELEEKA